MGKYATTPDALDARNVRVGVVSARFNEEIVERLHAGACAELERLGGAADVEVWVPGAFELPLTAKRLAERGTLDALVCLGAVVRGGTPHFEYVAGECAAGLQRVALETGVPVVFGVLTTDDRDQALERSGGAEGNKGAEAAATAVEMVTLLRALDEGGS